MSRALSIGVFALLAATTGCSYETLDEAVCPPGGTELTYENFGRSFMERHCQGCHASFLEIRDVVEPVEDLRAVVVRLGELAPSQHALARTAALERPRGVFVAAVVADLGHGDRVDDLLTERLRAAVDGGEAPVARDVARRADHVTERVRHATADLARRQQSKEKHSPAAGHAPIMTCFPAIRRSCSDS